MAQFESVRNEIGRAGAQLVFVAAQRRGGFLNPEKYLREHAISFPFLLDEDRRVTKAYGVYHLIGLDAINIAHPASFVVARDGKVKFVYVGKSQIDRAPLEKVIATIAPPNQGDTATRRNR
jgi:peroxiredoxin